MTTSSAAPPPTIRLARADNDHGDGDGHGGSDSDADAIAIAALGRHVFKVTFAPYTSPVNMREYLDSTYTPAAVREAILAEDRIMYIAELSEGHDLPLLPPDLEAIDDERNANSKSADPSESAHADPAGPSPSPSTRIAAFLSLCTSSIEPCLSLPPHDGDGAASYPRPLELRTIYIHPSYHASGLAARLVRQAETYARENGYGSLWLGVYPVNARAIRFYEKCGFVKIGEHAFKLGDQVDVDDVMAKRL